MSRPSLLLRALQGLFGLAAACALLTVVAYFYVELAYADRRVTVENAEPAPLAIVFGAGLGQKGQPSPLLAARVETAVALYRAGKVQRVLLSGSTEPHHNETRAMRRLAEASGLPAPALLLDPEGLSTFDTCLRAQEVYGATRVILVTQQFHMPRALFIANSLGLNASGVVTHPGARMHAEFVFRELLARPFAIYQVLMQPSRTSTGKPLPPSG